NSEEFGSTRTPTRPTVLMPDAIGHLRLKFAAKSRTEANRFRLGRSAGVFTKSPGRARLFMRLICRFASAASMPASGVQCSHDGASLEVFGGWSSNHDARKREWGSERSPRIRMRIWDAGRVPVHRSSIRRV